MNCTLPPRYLPADDAVGVEIAREQQELEEEHAGRPDRRRAAEPGKDVFADERLNLEEKKRSEKDRQRVGEHRPGASLMATSVLETRGRVFRQRPCRIVDKANFKNGTDGHSVFRSCSAS